ncbi:hypothetical protein [Flavilitoribacter nigricans]|uniref:hypothetical protein n=1 Tax=Flavilitoribacter nigricans TaxID=70997 RepID=UPI00147583B7|nr:hypothetical protein [Flavilitoribacter nigricans]
MVICLRPIDYFSQYRHHLLPPTAAYRDRLILDVNVLFIPLAELFYIHGKAAMGL